MKLNVFSIKDSKTAHFEKPFTAVHSGEVIREFEDLKANKETKYGKFPEDFSLYVVGTYDTEIGLMEAVNPTRLS